LDGILSLSSKPLLIIFVIGVLSSAASLLGFIFYLIWIVSGAEMFGRSPADVPGFTSIILLLFLLSGIQLISMGIIGAYTARVYDETKGRPIYLLKEVKRGSLAQSRAKK
jgi:polyisoprenyl-phosphate glycosyltransferase